jgi:microcystin-dependent protein
VPQNRFYSSTAVQTTLSGGINAAVTSIAVASVTGFPSSFPYTLILERDTANQEIIEVTDAAGTTLTVVRGQDGTSGLSHSTGAVVEHGVSAQDFNEPQAHIAASAGVHGVTGSVAGTSDSQTLTNKTISGANNTLTVREADLSLSDNTTGNVSTTRHGLVPKAPNDSTKFLDGTGAYSTPSTGSGSAVTGEVKMYAGASTPSGYLDCDGTAVSRTTYSDLFAALGTTYGVGNGSTTFNLPNFSGKVPRGNTRTSSGGSDTHQHSAVSAGTPSGSVGVSVSVSSAGSGVSVQSASSTGLAAVASGQGTIGTHGHGVTDSGHSHSAGGSGSFSGSAMAAHQHDSQSNVPAYVGLKFIIKT